MDYKKMWAYLMHLSTNMWNEPGAYVLPSGFWEDHLTTEDEVWKKVIDFLPGCGFNTVLIDVGDGVQFESHPEVSIPGAWSKEKLKAELDRIRALGMTPIPKLNFSAAHDAWLKIYSRMVSTPQYYQVCEDLIREVAELFDHPAYFHLGMDEEWAQGSENMKIVRPRRIWWHDVNFLFDVCDKVGARPWVWADPCYADPEDYCKNMSKDALQSNWYYGTLRKNPDGSYQKIEVETYRILEKAGFDQVPTSSALARWYNASENMEMGKEIIAPERLKGYLTCPWYFAYDRYYYALLHEAYIFKYAKEKQYPEECQ
ncbi:MAG: hypothetical protein IJT78_00540 [Oscillospiraceae bacterium]|nr:hypothetical protein [Oscillospiraceae bacterium]